MQDPDQPEAAPNFQPVVAEESSVSEFDFEPDDQVFALCRSGDIGTVDIVVYNEQNNDLFLHHSIDLPFLPLQTSSFCFKPLTDQVQGAFMAVLGFSKEIEIYDLNQMDQIKPNYILAQSKYMKNKQEVPCLEAHKGSAIITSSWSKAHPNIFVTGGDDGSVRFWDLSQMNLICALENVHKGGVNNIQFISNKEQQFITTGIIDQTIKYFDFKVNLQKEICSLQLQSPIEQLLQIDENTQLVSTSNGEVAVINVIQKQILLYQRVFQNNIPVTGLTFENGFVVASSPETDIIHILFLSKDDNKGQLQTTSIGQIREKSCYSLAITNGMLLCGLGSSLLKIFDIQCHVEEKFHQQVFGKQKLTKRKEMSLNIEGDAQGNDEDDDQ